MKDDQTCENGGAGGDVRELISADVVMFKSTCPFLQPQTGNVTCQWIFLLLCLWSPVTGVGCLLESSDTLSIISRLCAPPAERRHFYWKLHYS